MSRRQLIALWGLAALLLVVLWARDQVRPWKTWQLAVTQARLDFVELQAGEVEARLAPALAELESALDAAKDDARSRRADRKDLERELFGLERNARRARGRLDGSTGDERREARIEVETLEEMAADRRRRLDAMAAPHKEAADALAATRAPLDALYDEVRELGADRWLRRLPGLRHLSPSLGVKSAAGERCVTCHLGGVDGLDVGSAEGLPDVSPAVLAAHPRRALLDLHGAAAVGCVSCHGGDPAATDLAAAGHIPQDPETADRWRREWGWREGRVREPILTGTRTVAGCASCHGGDAEIPGAPAWRRGLRLAANLRCGACHGPDPGLDFGGWTAPSVDLTDVAAKTTRTRAARRLLETEGQRKPDFWRGRPPAERDVEVAALVEALWRRARPAATPSLPAGRPARGGELFVGLGCGACHVAGEARSGFAGGLEEADELRRGWLGAFLLDGHRPRLRLDPSEAADVAAYLTPDPPDGGDSAGPDGPSIDPAIRDRLLLAALETETTIEGAQAAFEALDDGERTLRLADHLLERYACAACHRLSGLEAPPLEGSFRLPASEAARDWLAALGSGGAGAPDARDVHADVTSPSSGAYDLSAEEWLLLEAVSLRPNPARAAAAPRSAAEAGRQVVARHGCRACHEVESAGGDLAPSLDRAAPRLQSTWVASVLTGEAPPVRHWFEVRMPDFELTAGEVDAAVADLARMAGQTRTALRGPSPSRRDLAVGKAAFEVLQCGRCHGTGPEAAVVSSAADDGWEGLLPVVLAPDYRWSRERLRSDWLREYVRGPRALDPQSTLPGIFPELEGGRADSSYLLGALGTPMFHLQQLRLLQHFEDDLDLARHLSEPDEVAAGLAAYVESLEPPG